MRQVSLYFTGEYGGGEWLHFDFSLSCIGGGNGNPLQCSCLENPRDGGAWWAAIYGVTQSRTRLKRLSSSSSMAGGKEPACKCRRLKRLGFDLWVGKIPWRKSWQPTLVFLPREDMDRGAWRATVQRGTKNQTQLKRLSTHMVREVN